MNELEQFRLDFNLRLVFVRWVFLLVGILILAGLVFLTEEGWLPEISAQLGGSLLFLGIMVVVNLPLYLLINKLIGQQRIKNVNYLSWFQIIFDLFIVAGLLFFTGINAWTILLMLWPLISGIVLFGYIGSGLVLIISWLVILGLSLADSLITSGLSGLEDHQTWSVLVVSGLVYLLVYAGLAYHYQFIRPMAVLFGAGRIIHHQDVSEYLKRIEELEKRVMITERKAQAKDTELEMAKQKLNNLEQAKSKFISVTTHQLRTPLAAIKWTLGMMNQGQLGEVTEEQKDFLQRGLNSTQKMITIVNNLLNIDHIEADKRDYNFAEISLADLINKTVQEFSSRVESKNINLEVKIPEKTHLVEADLGKIRMVLENLLDNAIKYSKNDGQVTVELKDDRINSAQSSLEVVVKDNGIGIPEAEQKKIFHKFFRASNAVANEPDGSGIGLYISKDIIENHKGTFWFESVEGEGTAFHFILPLKQPTSVKASTPPPAPNSE
ncbi:MAG: ATP-binding protein [Patescibacteria group bacterium]